jgi:hypothetical protein
VSYALSNVNEGDHLFVVLGRHSVPQKRTVAKATKMKVTDDKGAEWTRSGYEWGVSRDHWGGNSMAVPWTPAHEQRIEEAKQKAEERFLRSYCRGADWEAMTIEKVRAVYAVLTDNAQ